MAMASSLLLASPSPLSLQLQTSTSHLSFSRSQTLHSPLITSSFPSLSASFSPTIPSVYCGRGDKKTAKGKRFRHSYGNARPRNKNKGTGAPRIYTPTDYAKKEKVKLDDKEIIKIDIED